MPVKDRALYWVAKNRTRADSVRRIGEWVISLSNGLGRDRDNLGEAARVIAAGVDAEFHDHCWVGAIQGDCVVVYVGEPAMIAPLRLRWSTMVLRALRAQWEFKTIRRVLFDHGRSGVSVRRQLPNTVDSLA